MKLTNHRVRDHELELKRPQAWTNSTRTQFRAFWRTLIWANTTSILAKISLKLCGGGRVMEQWYNGGGTSVDGGGTSVDGGGTSVERWWNERSGGGTREAMVVTLRFCLKDCYTVFYLKIIYIYIYYIFYHELC